MLTGALRGLKETEAKCVAPCLTDRRKCATNDGRDVNEGEEENFDVSDPGAKPGNSQAPALKHPFAEKRDLPLVNSHPPLLCLL